MSKAKEYYRDLTYKNKKLVSTCVTFYETLNTRAPIPFLFFFDKLPEKNILENYLLDFITGTDIHFSDIIVIIFELDPMDKKRSWEAIDTGIRDIYYWYDQDDFRNYINSTILRQQEVTKILESPLVSDNLIGQSKCWKHFLSRIIEVSLFSQSSVLLIGESGTGKELISRLIHTIDKRENKKDLVLLDCTTIVPELSGSEFFGHERGSYTNAIQSREGAFALANKGTLFLDEIGELPAHLQAALLRVIQEGIYKKVGSNSWQKTLFRLICATHRNLRQCVEDNTFRQDLFFRISDFEFRVPSLKERTSDIELLAKHFLQEFFAGKDPPEFGDCVLEYLIKRDYPGNVRELRQLVYRIALRHVNHKRITLGELPLEDRWPNQNHQLIDENIYLTLSLKNAILSGASLWDLKNKTMDDAIKIALEMTNGNKKLAAEKLGVTLRAVQKFLQHK